MAPIECLVVRRNKKVPGRIFVPTAIPFDCVRRSAGRARAKHLYILLHGFSHAGSKIFDELVQALPADSLVLAPNGPFPVPRRHDKKYRLGFSWYFYDARSKEFFIGMEPAIEFIATGLKKMKVSHLPKTIIGFSQGGYMAPFLAQKLTRVERVIGIGCEYLHENLPKKGSFRVDAIAGEADELISLDSQKLSHERLMKSGYKGAFFSVPRLGHRVDIRLRKILKELLA